ncbi:MAG: hypothetical protein U0T83_00135 [Bacteriovoracaceae bacterium]
MKFVLKFLLFFSVSFLILTISFNGRPFFDILDETTAPVIDSITSTVKYGLRKGMSMGKDFGKRIFSNSIPSYSDKVKSAQSGLLREKSSHNSNEASDIDEESTDNFIDEYSKEHQAPDELEERE